MENLFYTCIGVVFVLFLIGAYLFTRDNIRELDDKKRDNEAFKEWLLGQGFIIDPKTGLSQHVWIHYENGRLSHISYYSQLREFWEKNIK